MLDPSSVCRAEIDRFLQGAPRSDLCPAALREIASMRFVSLVETTIEGRHARVALAHRRHPGGPVATSLSNRLPMLEQWIRRKHVDIMDVVQAFSACRHLRVGAGLLNMERHPCLTSVKRHLSSAAYHPWLTKALYHCSIEDMYRQLPKDIVATDDAGKRRQWARDAKEVRGKHLLQRATYQDVLKGAIVEHVGWSGSQCGTTLACPAAMMKLTQLSEVIGQPSTNQYGGEEADRRGALQAGEYSSEDEVAVGFAEQPMYFRVVLANLGNKKMVKIPVGCAGHSAKCLQIMILYYWNEYML